MESAGDRRSAEAAITELRAAGFPLGRVRAVAQHPPEGPCVRLTLPFDPPLDLDLVLWKRDGRPGDREHHVRLRDELGAAFYARSREPELARLLFDLEISARLMELAGVAQRLQLDDERLVLMLAHENDDFRDLRAIAANALEAVSRIEFRRKLYRYSDHALEVARGWREFSERRGARFDPALGRIALETAFGELDVALVDVDGRKSTLLRLDFSPSLPLGVEICERSELGLVSRLSPVSIADPARKIELFAKGPRALTRSEVSDATRTALLELRAHCDALYVSSEQLLCRVDDVIFERGELERLFDLVLDAADCLGVRQRDRAQPYR